MITFTEKEIDDLRKAVAETLRVLHYCNRDRVTGLPAPDVNVNRAISMLGPAYRTIKSKLGE